MEIFIPTSNDKILYINIINLYKFNLTYFYNARIISRKKITTINNI